MTRHYSNLKYLVQCQRPNSWFDTIAAFDCKIAADGYAADCMKSNNSFNYKVVVLD